MNQVYIDFLKYRDQYGLTGLQTDGTRASPTQNGVLFSMEYLITLLEAPDTTYEVNKMETRRVAKAILKCEDLPGLLRRNPDSTEQDSMDNCGAAIVLSAMHKRSFAKRMYDHGRQVQCHGIDEAEPTEAASNRKWYPWARVLNFGRKPRNYWNNQRPAKFCQRGWFGRSPGFMAMLKLCATGNVGPWGNFVIMVSQFLGLFSKGTDGIKLAYVNWYYLKRCGKVWRSAYRLWQYGVRARYPKGMIDVYAEYYQDPAHPIRKHTKEFH